MDKIELEDGTNVIAGTEFTELISVTSDWYRPSDTKGSPFSEDKWIALRGRFERIIDDCRPVECLMVQMREPAYQRDQVSIETIVRQTQLLQSSGGLSREMTQLFTKDSQPLFGAFPICDANGNPICNSANEPFALRFGLFRQLFVCEGPSYVSEARPFPGPRLIEFARDASRLLYQLPAQVASSLWRNWSEGFSRRRNSDEYFWLDALFELSWQGQAGEVLNSERYAWRGNTSVQLVGNGLFPRMPSEAFVSASTSIPHEYGYPMAWHAKLPDLARASVAAIDELLRRGRTKPAPLTVPDQVFISYSHKDKKFLNDLLTHLKPYVRSSSVTAWSDKQIAPGSKWLDEIKAAIERTKVAILLVTKDFLASDFIHEFELGPLLKGAAESRVKILWVLVRACSYKETAIKDLQALVAPPAKPLAEMKAERDRAWVSICEGIKSAVNEPVD